MSEGDLPDILECHSCRQARLDASTKALSRSSCSKVPERISVSAMTQFLSSMRGGQDRHRVLWARCRSAFMTEQNHHGKKIFCIQMLCSTANVEPCKCIIYRCL